MLRELRSHTPPSWVRIVLVSEVVGYLLLAAGFVWFVLGTGKATRVSHVVYYVFAAVAPIALNLLHGDRPADSGLRLDNLGASAKEVGLATALMAAGLVAGGLASGGFHWVHWKRFWELSGAYVGWGLGQQYLLQAFAFRRLRQGGLGPWPAAGLAAGGFAMLHAPNWPLVGLTFFSGMVWCRLFLRRPNLLTLGTAHGVLAVLTYHALPVAWMHKMAVGHMYLEAIGP